MNKLGLRSLSTTELNFYKIVLDASLKDEDILDFPGESVYIKVQLLLPTDTNQIDMIEENAKRKARKFLELIVSDLEIK